MFLLFYFFIVTWKWPPEASTRRPATRVKSCAAQLCGESLGRQGIDCERRHVSLIGPVLGGVGKYCACTVSGEPL